MTDFGPAATIDQFIRSNWTATPVVDGHDLDDLPNPPEPILVIEHHGGAETLVGVGSPGQNLWRENGATNFHVYVPATAGWLESDRLGRELRAMLRGQDVGGVFFDDTTGPEPHEKAPAGYVASLLVVGWYYDAFA